MWVAVNPGTIHLTQTNLAVPILKRKVERKREMFIYIYAEMIDL